MASDNWHLLKQYTNARIAMGRAGCALPSNEILQFRMAHALARDAVYSELRISLIDNEIQNFGKSCIHVFSQAKDRNDFLRYPDKGKALSFESSQKLKQLEYPPHDLCIIIADGLSADAANQHGSIVARGVMKQLSHWTFSPIILASQSRVALSDAIGELLSAKIVVILLGERPGLSSPSSLGAYITYGPKLGNTDERRNCVSNIHPDGLSYELAISKIVYLLEQMHSQQISGVALKDTQGNLTEGSGQIKLNE